VKRKSAALLAAVLLAGCGVDEDAADATEELESTVLSRWEDDGDDRRFYLGGLEMQPGSRIEVTTQLGESQTEVADTICGYVVATSSEFDKLEDLSGVDVAAAGGRHIANCEPIG